MKEILRTMCFAITARFVSRFGVIGKQETITISKLPKRGVYSSLIGRPDIRTTPTSDLLTGFFVISSRRWGGYTVVNRYTRVMLTGIPRRSMRKILDGVDTIAT